MAGLLYHFPEKKVGRHLFERAGLVHALEGRSVGTVGTTARGPSGREGCIVAPPCPRGHAPAPQAADGATWVQVPGQDVWLGWLPDARPSPQDLARATQVPGHEVQLADGASWLVPVARRVNGSSALPRALRWDGQAWSAGDVVAAHARLWGVACRLWDALLSASEGGTVTLDVECDAVALALATNYRLGPPELSALGLLTTAARDEVIKALVDLPVLEALQGKAGAAGRSSPPGGED